MIEMPAHVCNLCCDAMPVWLEMSWDDETQRICDDCKQATEVECDLSPGELRWERLDD